MDLAGERLRNLLLDFLVLHCDIGEGDEEPVLRVLMNRKSFEVTDAREEGETSGGVHVPAQTRSQSRVRRSEDP